MWQAHDADDDEFQDEYDLSTMTIVPKGRYSPERRMGNNVAILAPDLVEAFPNDDKESRQILQDRLQQAQALQE